VAREVAWRSVSGPLCAVDLLLRAREGLPVVRRVGSAGIGVELSCSVLVSRPGSPAGAFAEQGLLHPVRH
jgi:hypothetical protein